MSALSDTMERYLLDLFFGDEPSGWSRHTDFDNWKVALYTAAPSDAGGGTEVSGGSYARVTLANSTANWGPAATNTGVTTTANAAVIQFSTASAGWGNVTHFALFDNNNVFRAWGALTTSRTVLTGDAPRFPIGAFVISAD